MKKILGNLAVKHKFNVGDIIEIKDLKKIKILEQIMIKQGKNNYKGYNYQCLVDGYKDKILESNLDKGMSCSVCANKIVSIGINDIWTTNPKLAELLANPEDGFLYSQGSSKKVDWKCSICGGIIKNRRIVDIRRQGFSCPNCSDSIPYTEKFMGSVLEQLNLNFQTQLTKTVFDWCDGCRYDFYIDSINCIIETHDAQHYKEQSKNSMFKRTLAEEQENDMIKQELALKNGIKNYIIIDCRRSMLEFIKENILNSALSNFFDLNKIDWFKCHEYACSSLIKKACELWNNGNQSTVKIGKILKLNSSTIIVYLKKGAEIGWCDYDVAKVKINNINKFNKLPTGCSSVICLTTNEIFNSIEDARKKYNVFNSAISNCCLGKYKSSGNHPVTGEKLVWAYYNDDFIKLHNEAI